MTFRFLRDVLGRRTSPSSPPINSFVHDGRLYVADGPVPQELPRAPRGTHYHVCIEKDCHSHIVCAKGPHCAVSHWVCPGCEDEQMSAWLEAESIRRQQENRS